MMLRKTGVWVLFFLMTAVVAMAQGSGASGGADKDFVTQQKTFKRVSEAFAAKEELLKAQFAEKKLTWPAKYMYIRSFKYDSQLEVWVKSDKAQPYRLFKSYKVCAMAGSMGPKRIEGDYQVPEGFYCVDEFRPNSEYHLALGVNYPNASDRLLSDPKKPGNAIYIHGSCVTVGCIPITDEQIKELYVLAATAHNSGQDFIPIHVFPIKYKVEKSREYLAKYLETYPDYKPFAEKLKQAYYFFEKNKQLPTILVNSKGEYVIAEEINFNYDKWEKAPEKPKPIEKIYATKVDFDESTLVGSVYKMPQYPGGLPAFQEFLDKVAAELGDFMPEGRTRIFVSVEFIVDKTGHAILPKVLTDVPPEMHNMIIRRFEAMPQWKPAEKYDKDVAYKLQQSIEVNGIPKAPPVKKKTDDDDE